MDYRRSRRYFLSLPVAVTRAGSEPIELSGLTSNISTTGVLFTTAESLAGRIEYTIELEGSVRLRCIGNVLRAEHNGHAGLGAYQVAATLERYEFVRTGKVMTLPAG